MLLKKTILYLPAQLFGPLAQLVAIIAWTHWLPSSEVGIYTLAVATREFVSNWTVSWWTAFVMRYLPRKGEGDRADYDLTELVSMGGASILQFVCVIGGLHLSLGSSPGLLLVTVAGVQAVVDALVVHSAQRSQGQGNVLAYSILSSTGPILGLAFGLAALQVLPPTASVILGALVVGQLIGFVFARVWRDYAPGGGRFVPALVKQGLVYGLPLVVTGMFTWVGGNAIRFLVEWKEGLNTLGLINPGWSLGLRAVEFIALLVTAAAFPLAVEKMRYEGPDAARRQFASNGALLLVVMVPAVVGVVMVARQVSGLLFSGQFAVLSEVFMPVAAAVGALRFARIHFSDQAFLVFERSSLVIWVGVLEAVATAGCAFIGLNIGGAFGAALGALAGAAITIAVSFLWARSLFGLYLRPLDVARICVATAAMAGSLAYLPGQVSVLALAIKISVGAAVYFAVLGVIAPDVRRALLKIALRKPL